MVLQRAYPFHNFFRRSFLKVIRKCDLLGIDYLNNSFWFHYSNRTVKGLSAQIASPILFKRRPRSLPSVQARS